jgi:hypothetical protein
MTKAKYFGIGLPILVVILSAFTGGIANAFWLVAASIVCTAGIGLAIWIPLAIGVGWVAFSVAQEIVKLAGGTPGMNSSLRREDGARAALQPAPRQHLLALDHYIQRAVRLNHSHERILSDLKRQGWSEAEINQVYQDVTGSA